jgi:hypothetical protein
LADVTPPAGTFLANVRDGAIHLPPPLKRYCDASHWNLFRVEIVDESRLALYPILPEDESGTEGGYCSSLSPEGRLWIPGALRSMVDLREQSVMARIENGVIGIYLRKVFETLGFGP